MALLSLPFITPYRIANTSSFGLFELRPTFPSARPETFLTADAIPLSKPFINTSIPTRATPEAVLRIVVAVCDVIDARRNWSKALTEARKDFSLSGSSSFMALAPSPSSKLAETLSSTFFLSAVSAKISLAATSFKLLNSLLAPLLPPIRAASADASAMRRDAKSSEVILYFFIISGATFSPKSPSLTTRATASDIRSPGFGGLLALTIISVTAPKIRLTCSLLGAILCQSAIPSFSASASITFSPAATCSGSSARFFTSFFSTSSGSSDGIAALIDSAKSVLSPSTFSVRSSASLFLLATASVASPTKSPVPASTVFCSLPLMRPGTKAAGAARPLTAPTVASSP